MAKIRSQLTEMMKNAMRARDQLRLDTVRFVLSQVKNAEIDLKREMEDEEIITLLKKEVKNRKEAIEQFVQSGRQELVDEETDKLKVIEEFLPAEMSDEELKKVVQSVQSELESSEFGMVMKAVMAKIKGQADGRRVSEMVKQVMNG